MKKNTRKTDVTIKLHDGSTITASDDNHGEGLGALLSLRRKDIIKVTDNDETTYIPFHAVEDITAVQTTTLEDIEDDFCPVEQLISVDTNIGASVDLFGKVIADLQENVAINGTEITGTLHYIDDYTGFSSNPDQQHGHYLALHFTSPVEGATITVKVTNPSVLDSDGIIVLLIADTSQTITVTVAKDGETLATKVYTISDLVLEPQG